MNVMTPEHIAETICQQLAEKDRSDLEQLGLAQTFRALIEKAEEKKRRDARLSTRIQDT